MNLLKAFGLVLVAVLFFPLNAQGQDETADAASGEASSEEATLGKKDQRTLEDAREAYESRKFMEAASLYEELLDKYPSKFRFAYRIGRCNQYMRKLDEAVDWYNTAKQIDAGANDTLFFDLGDALMNLGRYDAAKVQFKKFLDRHPTEDQFHKQAKIRIEGCDFALDKKDVKPTWEIQPVKNLNMEGTDFNPVHYVVKGDTFLIFTSHREDTRGNKTYQRLNESFSDLFITNMKDDSTAGEIENLGKKVNTKANDGSAVISPDGLTMYYTICGGGKHGKYYGCSIYKSKFDPDKNKWNKHEVLEGVNGTREVVVNTKGKTEEVPTYDAYPTLTPDGQTMYFISDRDGGNGATDIWYSTKIGNAWGTPVHAGPDINTPFNETSPTVGQDGETIYFASDGHPGFGGYDLFKAKGKEATWEGVENLGKELNSPMNDHSLTWVYPDSIGYVSSDRTDLGVGKFDIYRVEYIYQPPLDITVQGNILDKETKEPVSFALAILYEIDENKQLVPVDTFQTDQSARYEFPLEEEKDYKVVGNAPEYLAGERFISTKDARDSLQAAGQEPTGGKYEVDLEKDINIYLENIDIDEPIVLQNVYFDFDSSNIRSDAAQTLDRLVKIMNDNPNITIQLGAHTDTNGSEDYNKALSNRRASSVMDYLIERGIEKGRMSWFGYGETQPLIYPELSDRDEQANRRVEFRIKSLDYAEANDN